MPLQQGASGGSLSGVETYAIARKLLSSAFEGCIYPCLPDSLEPTQLMLVPLTPVQVLNAGQVDMSVRQMAAITLKNLCSTAWDPTETGSLRLHEEDKTTVRGALLGALLQLPPNLRSQLTEVAKSVIYSDYPDKVIKARVCGCTKTKSDAYNLTVARAAANDRERPVKWRLGAHTSGSASSEAGGA